jgi:hypothetical protein
LELLKERPASLDDCLPHLRDNWMSAGWHRGHLKFCGRNFRDGRWSGGRQLLARIPGLFIDFRPIRKARAHALDHCFEAQEQFLPLFVESLVVPQRDYHFEAFDDLCRVLIELFCFIKHFAHRAFASAAVAFPTARQSARTISVAASRLRLANG